MLSYTTYLLYIIPMAIIGLTLKWFSLYNPGYFLIFTLITANIYGIAVRYKQRG